MCPYSFVLAVWLPACQTVRLQGNVISHLLLHAPEYISTPNSIFFRSKIDTKNINREVLLLIKGFEQ